MILKKQGEIQYYCDEKIEASGGLKHIFTTWYGGCSTGPLSAMNMSPTRENPETVIKNYKKVCECEGIDASKCVLSHQTHTNNIRIVTEVDAGKGLFLPSDIKDTDGLVTNVPGLPIVIFYADCVPVLLYDHNKKVVATVHAGWRGTVSNIAGNAVRVMKDHFASTPTDILAAIGPSIGQCCFETGEEARIEFESAGLSDNIISKDGKTYINLQESNKQFLINAGLNEENISISGLCTKCRCDEFFSHRGCGSDTGRMALIACIK